MQWEQLKQKLNDGGIIVVTMRPVVQWMIIVVCVLALGLLGFQAMQNTEMMAELKTQSVKAVDDTRSSMIQGLFTLNKTIESQIPTRTDRMSYFMKKAKGVILSRNPKTDLTDKEINELLLLNFELSERYGMSPWIFMAFAAAESDFTKKAVSSADAKGIVQFMPSTMKVVLGSEYTPEIEFDPNWSCRAWYKYVFILTERAGGDLKWTAAAYMSPQAFIFMEKGKSLKDFMVWISSITENHVKYPWQIEELYHEYLQL